MKKETKKAEVKKIVAKTLAAAAKRSAELA